MILGLGTDIVSVQRMREALARTPALQNRLFTTAEQEVSSPERLAARFAAKEATAKALGVSWVGGWHDVEIVLTASGRPELSVKGPVAAAADRLGVQRWHLSLSHDGGSAVAVVIAEGSASS